MKLFKIADFRNLEKDLKYDIVSIPKKSQKYIYKYIKHNILALKSTK